MVNATDDVFGGRAHASYRAGANKLPSSLTCEEEDKRTEELLWCDDLASGLLDPITWTIGGDEAGGTQCAKRLRRLLKALER